MTSDNRAWLAIRAAVRRAAAWPFRVAAARAALRALANMDRRELADIGLNPCDLRDVSALPLDRDPTDFLTERARERRRDAFGAPPPLWCWDPLDEYPDDRPRRNLRRRVCDPGPREPRVVRTG
jgi:uncharacterized protein YjiS (DUF1127 family)